MKRITGGEDGEDRGGEITIDEQSWKPNRECEVACVPGSPFQSAD